MGERWLEEVVVVPMDGTMVRSSVARWAGGAQACAVLVIDVVVACSGVVASAVLGLTVGIRLSSMWMRTGGLPGL